MTYPPDQARHHDQYHMGEPRQYAEHEGYLSDSDASSASSPGIRGDDQSRYSRDYQFTSAGVLALLRVSPGEGGRYRPGLGERGVMGFDLTELSTGLDDRQYAPTRPWVTVSIPRIEDGCSLERQGRVPATPVESTCNMHRRIHVHRMRLAQQCCWLGWPALRA